MVKREYIKEVVRRAWSKTTSFLGWRMEKFVAGLIAVVAIVIVGGVSAAFKSLLGSLGVAAAFVIVATVAFIWNVIEAQADMYWDVSEAKGKENDAAGIRPNLRRRPAADFEKWRHVPALTLQEAAQLWAGEQPGMGMFGVVKDNYAMLRGAVENGDLDFIFDTMVEPRMMSVIRERMRENPGPDMKVTRQALKGFANQYKYKPKFLED